MTLEQLEYIISQLERMAVAAQKKGESRKWSRLSTHVTELKRWRDKGMQGACPVDYKTFGIKLPKGGAGQKPGAATSPKKKSKATRQKAQKTSETSMATKPSGISDALSDSEISVATSVSVSPVTTEAPSGDVMISVEDEMQDLTIRENLSRAEKLLSEDEFASAIYLAETILNQTVPDEIRQRAQQVENEAKVKREAQISALLELAKKAFNDKAWDAAEKNYRQALELDEEDQRALEGLNALLSSKSETEQKAHLEEIKFNLQAFNQIDVLANAVREAEQLIARKKADDELVRLHKAGKERWDELREKHGQTTTKARVGTLESRAEAVHEYEQMIIHNQMKVWDATLNTVIPTDEALREARKNWEVFSQQETQKRLNEVERNLPHNLDWAKQRLTDAINQQYYDTEDIDKEKPLGYSFFEHDRSEMQARLAEIEQLIKNRDHAETLRERARTASPEDGLKLLMEARNHWQHLEGIDKQIAEQGELVARLFLDQSNAALGQKKFEKSRTNASKALSLLQQLSGMKLPVSKEITKDAEQVLEQVERQQKSNDEFVQTEQEIRRLLKSPNTRQAAFDLFEKIGRRPQFRGPQLDALRFEILGYRKGTEALAEIQVLVNSESPDWVEIHKLSESLMSRVRGGELEKEVSELLNRADTEVKIHIARQAIKDGDIRKAEETIKNIRKVGDREAEIKPLIDEIEAVKKNDAEARPKFNRALSVKRSENLNEKLNALQMFREVADHPRRSSFTVEARREADDLGGFLRETILKRIESVHSAAKSLTDADLEEAAEWASILRTANLAWGSEKRLIREAEMAYARSVADKQAKAGQWGDVVRTWEALNAIYDSPEINLEAKMARKQKAILDAQIALTQENAQKALDVLREEQTRDDWGGDVDLNYQLAEAYRRLGKYEDAERCALTVKNDQDAAHAKRGEALLNLIHEDRTVTKANKEISELKEKGDYESALEVLRKLPQDLRDRNDVSRIRDEIVLHAQSELLKAVRKEKEKSTTQGIVNAVEMLIRLRGIEKLSPTIEGKSEEQLNQFRGQLPAIANQVVKTAGAFNPTKMSLEDALRDARRISNQLQAFLGVADDFPSTEWPAIKEQIQGRLTRMSDRVERLEKIKELLDKATVDGTIWKQAIKIGNFVALDNIGKSLYEISGQDAAVIDLREFGIRLIETMEIRRHIGEQFNLLKEGDSLFLAKEDFRAVVKICESLRNLPTRSGLKDSRGSGWKTINQDIYLNILAIADSELDFYDNVLEKRLSKLSEESGKSLLDTLSALAAQRQADLQKWDNWLNTGQRLHEAVRVAFEVARKTVGGAAEVVKEWKKALNHAKKAESHFAVEPALLSSRLAMEIKEDALSLSTEIIRWRESSEREIEKYSECASQTPPSFDDLKRLSQSRNYSVLAESLIRAKFNNTDETYYRFALHLEDTVLRNLRDFPPLEKLHELQETAERCLGVDDTLTHQIAEKIQRRQKPRGILDLFRS
jgi:hypothetical protein